jgi:hypothetical protein
MYYPKYLVRYGRIFGALWAFEHPGWARPHVYTYYQAIWSAIRSTANNTTTPITRDILGGTMQCVYQGNAQKMPDTSGKTLITIQGFSVKNSFDIYRGG